MVVSKYTLTHTSQILPTATTRLVTKALVLLMLVFSTAHTCLFRWFVRLVKTPSNQRSDLRLATAWSLILSQPTMATVLLLAWVVVMVTSTTDLLRSQTLCNKKSKGLTY